jgi:cytochrome bd-type quinol oxidase subunit 2
MKRILNAGAEICCVIGFLMVGLTVVGWLKLGLNIFKNRNNFYGLFIAVAFIFLALSPLYLSRQAHRKQSENLRFVIIGVIELVIIVLFVGMLFPRL